MNNTTNEPERLSCIRLVRLFRCAIVGHAVYPCDHEGKSLMRRTAEGVEADCHVCGKTIQASCGLHLCGLVWCRKPNAGGMARELAALDSDNPNDING